MKITFLVLSFIAIGGLSVFVNFCNIAIWQELTILVLAWIFGVMMSLYVYRKTKFELK